MVCFCFLSVRLWVWCFATLNLQFGGLSSLFRILAFVVWGVGDFGFVWVSLEYVFGVGKFVILILLLVDLNARLVLLLF